MGADGQHHVPALVTYCTGDSFGSRTSLNGGGKSRPHRGSIRGLFIPQRDVTPITPSRSTEWRLHLQEIKHDITRDICSAKVKTFRWLDDVVLDESRNFDILVDGKIHNLEWGFCGLHRKGFIFSESEWGGLREKRVVPGTWGNMPAFSWGQRKIMNQFVDIYIYIYIYIHILYRVIEKDGRDLKPL